MFVFSNIEMFVFSNIERETGPEGAVIAYTIVMVDTRNINTSVSHD